MNIQTKQTPSLEDAGRKGLPAWTYYSEELLDLEKSLLFRRHWQIACHLSDLPEPGDYVCLDMAGERAIVMRGKDGEVRAFHNVCRHRGSRVVTDGQGRCPGVIVCPFHGWAYNLDGTLRGAPKPAHLPELDREAHGLIPLDFEIWHGFVFVRFDPAAKDMPSVAALLAPYEAEAAAYRMDEVKPLSSFDSCESPFNWKASRDVDNEGYHVPIAHPSLQDLYGRHYVDDRHLNGVSRSFAPFNKGTGRLWTVRHYKKLLPDVDYLPESHRRAWLYLGIFPASTLVLYPDMIGFYQEYPTSLGTTVTRSAAYAVPDARREMRLARYLSQRIDRITVGEDQDLARWSWEAMRSSGYRGMILSDLEAGVSDYHDYLRRHLPVMTLDDQPAPGRLAATNAALLAAQA